MGAIHLCSWLVGEQFVGITLRFTGLPACLVLIGMGKSGIDTVCSQIDLNTSVTPHAWPGVDRNMPRSNEFIIRLCFALGEPGEVISRMLLQAPV